MSVNKAILIGNLGRDPEVRYTQSGKAICNFSMATTESWGKGDDKQDKTEWHNIVIWGRQGETAAEYLHKGSKVYIEGKISTRKWQDKNGNDRYTTEIVAREMQFLDSKGSGSGGGKSGNSYEQDIGYQAGNDMDDDDIPF